MLRLNTVGELVKPSSPSPFPRRRLRREAEKFIVERAIAQTGRLRFAISLPEMDATGAHHVTAAVREHFAVRLKEEQKKLARARRLGWRSLVIGLVFLSATIVLVELMKRYLPAGHLLSVVEGGLQVLAWVALWKPGELLLYEWIPFRRDARLFSTLEGAEFEFTTLAASVHQ